MKGLVELLEQAVSEPKPWALTEYEEGFRAGLRHALDLVRAYQRGLRGADIHQSS